MGSQTLGNGKGGKGWELEGSGKEGEQKQMGMTAKMSGEPLTPTPTSHCAQERKLLEESGCPSSHPRQRRRRGESQEPQ